MTAARLVFLDGSVVNEKHGGGGHFIYAKPIAPTGTAAGFGAIDLDVVWGRKVILPAYMKHTLPFDRMDGSVMVYTEREPATLKLESVSWRPRSAWRHP